MNIEEVIVKKKDIEVEVARRLNAFTEETGLVIERVTVDEKLPRIHGHRTKIKITLDVRL